MTEVDYEDISQVSPVIQKLQQEQEIEDSWVREDLEELQKSPFCRHCFAHHYNKNKAVLDREYYCTMSWLKDKSMLNKKTDKIMAWFRDWRCRKCGLGTRSVEISPLQYRPMEEQ